MTPLSPLPRRRVVLDTDTYNEVDDQFALAHLLLSRECLDLEAVYAAPFHNSRSTGPGDGMEKSFEEIHRVLDMLNPPVRPPVFRGSTTYLPDATTPVPSSMVEDLVKRAMASKDMLYVVAIGAITNVASALLSEPRIAEKITVVWLGGHAPTWPHTREFNLQQDLHGARVLLDGQAPLVLIPCDPVASHLSVTVAELEKHLESESRLGAYLTDIVRNYNDNMPGRSKVIWDISASGWMVNPGWIRTTPAPSPLLKDDCTWETPPPPGRRIIDIAQSVDRDGIFMDFFAKAKATGGR